MNENREKIMKKPRKFVCFVFFLFIERMSEVNLCSYRKQDTEIASKCCSFPLEKLRVSDYLKSPIYY